MKKITLGHLSLNSTAVSYIADIVKNNRLSRGKYTEKFERVFTDIHGCSQGVFCNSGTSALQIALAALKEKFEYKDGDEVLVPATTFIATSNVVLQNGLKPVFVDVDPRTYNMDPAKIEESITPRTRCIIPVHLFGLPANMEAIMLIARERGLQVLEDSCETMFAGINGKSVGSFGDIACFSTYVAHIIVGGVGGLAITNSSKLANLCRSLMSHGRDSIYTSIDDDDNPKFLKDIIERRYSFERVGYSYRATEIEAAIALSEFDYWRHNVTIRRQNARRLTNLLSDIKQLQLPIIPEGYNHSFMMYPMVAAEQVDREKLLLHMEERGIETRYLFPLLTQPIYRKLFPREAEKHPVSLNLSGKGFFIGMHQGMSLSDMDYISDVIHEYFK